MYNKRIVNLYPHVTQSYQLGYSDYVQFWLLLCCFHIPRIPTDISVSTFPLVPSLRLLHVFITQLDSLVSLHSFLGFPNLLNNFLLFVYIKGHSSCCTVMGFNRFMSCIHYYIIIENNFTALKILYASSIPFSTIFPNSGNY